MDTELILVIQSGHCHKAGQIFETYEQENNQRIKKCSLQNMLSLFLHKGQTKGLLFVGITKHEFEVMDTVISTITDRFEHVDVVMIFEGNTNTSKLNYGRNRFLDVINEEHLTVKQINAYIENYTRKISSILEPDYLVVKYHNKIRKIRKDDIILIETTNKPHQLSLVGNCHLLEFPGKMKEYEDNLGSKFARISKSCLVRKEAIISLDTGTKELELSNNMIRKVAVRKFKEVKNIIAS